MFIYVMVFAILLRICRFLLGVLFRARFSAKTDKLIHGVPPAADKKLETRWSELNPDLLRLVAKKLGDISNVVRFRVVCKQWRCAVSPSDLPSQLPWFLELVTGRLSSDIDFYSLYSNKTYTLRVPEANEKLVEGPSESYLLLKDDIRSTPILVNPISRHQLRPPYLNPDGTDGRELIKRTACCGRPATFYKGNLYHYCFETNDIKVIDTHKNISTIPGKFDFCHLVNADDDLLGVVRENWFTDEWRYKVYRLEQGGKTPFWAEMSQGIGDRVLFVDINGGFCLKSSDFDGLEGNKIYCHRGILFDYHCLAIYDLEKETKQVICPIALFGTWFVPSL